MKHFRHRGKTCSEATVWGCLMTRSGEHLLKATPKEDLPQRASDIKAALQNVVTLLRQRFGGTEKSILLSGHGTNGRALLQMILPKNRWPEKISIVNTGIWMVEELPDGTFALTPIPLN
jgi:broad specificity phosphatase PhoE